MATYVIGQIRVKDQQAWQNYAAQVGKVIEQYGGTILFRGRSESVLSGDPDAPDLVVAIRFDNAELAKRWHDSADYQALVPVREQGEDVHLVVYGQLN
ncbi:MAG: DUF1330 domain-containing protein [Saprospiraceae bacterium]|nr:DUF1330 domain-containing protein [Saprospiraceae bacterium]